MDKPDIHGIDTRMKWGLLVLSLVTLGFLIVAALRENVFAGWRTYRLQYARILDQKATDAHGVDVAAQFEVRVMQNVLPDLQRTDRCVTCHTGVDDPRMADQAQPFTTHPGDYLLVHPPSKFGCSVCHEGQGLATEEIDAHGQAPFWNEPILKKKFMTSTCTRCHVESDLHGSEGLLARMRSSVGPDASGELLGHGKLLVETKGCLGCHMLNEKGGMLGPDITFVGDKTRHEFDFSYLDRHAPREVEHWLKQHFLDPGRVSPQTVMPAAALSEREADALTAYMLSLRSPASVAIPGMREGTLPLVRNGAELYGMYCAACHGADGRSDAVPHIRTPSLNNVDALAVASDDYYRHIITEGRSGSKMPAWGDSGLTRSEIDRIVDFVRSWESEGADIAQVSARRGDPAAGKSYYRGLCANCHGVSGEGGIGNALRSPTFLGLATDSFIAGTIIEGRPGTAMASWKHLSADAVSDILAYIRTWTPSRPTLEETQARLSSTPREKLASIGAHLYRGKCASCHGQKGEGGIGLTLSTPDLLRVADDEFLYRSITEGRPSTAMPAWPELSATQLASIIAYLRSWQSEPALALEEPRERGDYELGEVLYRISCLQCHGADGRGGSGPQLANPAFQAAASDAMLYHWISRGRTGTAMKGFLSSEQGVTQLRPSQILDVIAYLRKLKLRDEHPILRTGVGNPKLGGELYAGTCSACHGSNGEGGSGPQLNNPAFLRTASDGYLAATIVLGRAGTAMLPMVHGQEGVGQIPPEQVADIVAYMRLWEYPETWRKPRSVSEMSPRAIASGKLGYQQYCSGCHGVNGGGVQEGPEYFAPSLNSPEFLSVASDGFLLATIARGRSHTPMRPFGKGAGGIVELDGATISDIVSYLRTWEAPGAAAALIGTHASDDEEVEESEW
ncbi:MAG: c-type cytochrome [Verrucomicrobia bacterium]|nr:c-type cytochrome [Verrucomicrobiota bacterium]MDA1086561.1 c-type cytochrome [Verrucomicrobiota bacterium]